MTLVRGLALLALLPATVALAQPKPALVQSRDEPARDPYQKEVAAAPIDCTSSGCVVAFPAVPAGKRLVVTHISVVAATSDASTTYGVVVLSHAGVAPSATIYLPIAPMGPGATNYFYLSAPITYYVEAGDWPHIQMVLTGSTSATVTLVGYSIALP